MDSQALLTRAEPVPAGPMRIHAFSTGRVRVKKGERGIRRYLPGGWRGETLPVNVFAIEHPRGLCLFDAGQTARAARPGYFPRWYPFFKLARFELAEEDEAAAQLRRLGLDPGDVRWVVLSHMHTDHVGGLEPFRSAEVVVSAEEWRRATGIGGRLRGYLPQHWPRGLEPRLVDFHAAGDAERPSFDLAGDGTLLVIPTPGHTPGHMGLLARGGEHSWFLGGDVVHTAAELPETAPWLQDLCAREGAAFLATHDARAAELVLRGSR